MGLAIGVGVLADLRQHDAEGEAWMRERITSLNEVLVREGLEPHEEPETFAAAHRRSVTSFPYSFLHYLRRAYACFRDKVPLRTGEYTDDDSDFVMDVTVTVMDSHLLSHSDCEGYYVPQSFPFPITDDAIPGGLVGSSQKLLSELLNVAPLLGIRCEGETLAAGEADALAAIEDGSDELWHEKIVWFALFEAAKLSIERNTLIVFH